MRPSPRSPIRRQHLEDVLRALGQDQPVQVTALADRVQGLSSPAIGHLVVPEITQRHAENSTPFAGRRRFTIPAIGGTASWLAGTPTWPAPLHAAIPRIFLRFGLAAVTRRADLGAAHPRIVRVITPLDPGDLPHSEGSLRPFGLYCWRRAVATSAISGRP
jgi:hypothetical protein